jgi:hypothetical protein
MMTLFRRLGRSSHSIGKRGGVEWVTRRDESMGNERLRTMLGESVATRCPQPGAHPYHVRLEVANGVAHVWACRGSLAIGEEPEGGYFTTSERWVRWYARVCQSHCNYQNARLAKNTERLSALTAAIRSFNDRTEACDASSTRAYAASCEDDVI